MCFSGNCEKENNKGQCTNILNFCIKDICECLKNAGYDTDNMTEDGLLEKFNELL